jgi:hypothetical protein
VCSRSRIPAPPPGMVPVCPIVVIVFSPKSAALDGHVCRLHLTISDGCLLHD